MEWLVEKRNGQTQNEKKNIKITDAKDLLELVSTRLSPLIGKISTLHGNMLLYIHEGGTPAAAVYVTFLSGVAFVISLCYFTLKCLYPPQRSYDCILSVEYTRKSAGEESKGALPNNVHESAFQRTSRAIFSSANFYIFYFFLLEQKLIVLYKKQTKPYKVN